MTNYEFRHITDLAALTDADLVEFIRGLPSLVVALRESKLAASEEGVSLAELIPAVVFVAGGPDTITLVANGNISQAVSLPYMGNQS